MVPSFSPIERLLRHVLAPLNGKDRNAASAGLRNGVEILSQAKILPPSNYRRSRALPTRMFDDLLGDVAPLLSTEAKRLNLLENG